MLNVLELYLFFLLMQFIRKNVMIFEIHIFPILFNFSRENLLAFKLSELPIALVKLPRHYLNWKTDIKKNKWELKKVGHAGMQNQFQQSRSSLRQSGSKILILWGPQQKKHSVDEVPFLELPSLSSSGEGHHILL